MVDLLMASSVNIFNFRRIVRKASSGTSAEMLYLLTVSLAVDLSHFGF